MNNSNRNLKSSDTNYIKMKTKTIVRKISELLSFMSKDSMLLPKQPCEYSEDFEHGESGGDNGKLHAHRCEFIVLNPPKR